MRYITQKQKVCYYHRACLFGFPIFFAVIKNPYATSMYLSFSTNELGTKYENSGVMWQVAPEYKIKFVSLKLSPKYLLGISTLEDIRARDANVFGELFCSVILSNSLYIFVYLYAQVFGFSVFQWTRFSEFSSFGSYANQLTSNPHLKHVFGFQLLLLVSLSLGLYELKYELDFLLYVMSFT